MLLSTRITGPWWFQRPLFSQSRPLCIKFNFYTSSSSPKLSVNEALPQALDCLDEECDDFLPWLERKAGFEISSVLSIRKSTNGRSLFASTSIQTGDCMLKVPYHAQLAPDNLLPEIDSLLSDEVSNVAKLAIVILVEQKMGQHSQWAPYVSRLPQPGEMHSSIDEAQLLNSRKVVCTNAEIFWCEDELEMIRHSIAYKETINKNAQIEKEFLAVKPALDHFPDMYDDVTLEDFRHAYALVESRAWKSTKGVSMIPFADFLNHDGLLETILLSDEDKKISEVIADRDYVPGEQVLIRYGKFSNATLLLDFGFTLPCNIYDEVSIPHQDHLCALKMELLQRHSSPIIKDENGFCSSWDSFRIKEVRSARGKGRGIPQSLRAFARVLCSTSSQDLNYLAAEAAQIDGRLARRPLKRRSTEIQAHQFLLSLITRLIDEHSMSVEELGLPNSPLIFEESTLRRKMALNLLTGELRVLKSASEWLKNYCATL